MNTTKETDTIDLSRIVSTAGYRTKSVEQTPLLRKFGGPEPRSFQLFYLGYGAIHSTCYVHIWTPDDRGAVVCMEEPEPGNDERSGTSVTNRSPLVASIAFDILRRRTDVEVAPGDVTWYETYPDNDSAPLSSVHRVQYIWTNDPEAIADSPNWDSATVNDMQKQIAHA